MASKLFVVDLDLNLNKAKQFVFEDLTTNPSATQARVYYNSVSKRLRLHNGTEYKELAFTDDVPAVSISLDAPDLFTVSGSPAAYNGTLGFEWNTQSANTILAGPATGANAIPTFRALTSTDIPSLTTAKISNFQEASEDALANILTASTHTGISVTYGDPAGTLSLTNDGVLGVTGTANEVAISADITNGTGHYVIGLPDNVTISNNLQVDGQLVLLTSGEIPLTYLESFVSGGIPETNFGNSNGLLKITSKDIFIGAVGGTWGDVDVVGNNIDLKSSGFDNNLGLTSSGTIGIVTESGDITLTSASDIILNSYTSGGGEYLGSIDPANQIATIGDITASAQSISNSDGNLSLTISGLNTQINLASNITVAGDLAVNGGDLTTTITGTFNLLSGSSIASLYIGSKSENIYIGYDNGTSTVTVGNDLIVTGDLTVQGSSVVLNTETLAVEDNIIVLNSNVSGTPTINAGIEVERGTETNASVTWDETAEIWKAGLTGSEFAIARKYVTTTTGTTHTITHNLNTQDVTVNCWVGGEQVEASVLITDANTVTVSTNTSQTIKTVVVG